MPTNIGDRPRHTLPNHRLDKRLLNDLYALIDRKIMRTFGNLMGPGWGCLTPPTFDLTPYASTQRIEVGACVLGYSWETTVNGNKEYEGGPVIYDPTNRQIQAESSVFVPVAWNATNVWLWFRRLDGPANTDMQRYYPVDQEEVAPTNTRYEEYVEFRATTQDGITSDGVTLSESTGWFRYARIRASSWVGSVPTIIEPISFYSGWYLRALGASTFDKANTWMNRSMGNDNDPDARWGLVQQTQAILNQLAQVKDGDVVVDGADAYEGSATETATKWDTDPDISLKQVKARLDNADVGVGLFPVWNGTVGVHGATRAIHTSAGASGVTLQSELVPHRYDLQVVVPSNWAYYGASVSHVQDMGPAYDSVPRVTHSWTFDRNTPDAVISDKGPGTYFLLLEAWDVDPDVNANTPTRVAALFDVTIYGRRFS